MGVKKKSVLLSKSFPAETRLTVYRRLQVILRAEPIHLYCRQREFGEAGLFFKFISLFLPLRLAQTNFTATFRSYFSGS